MDYEEPSDPPEPGSASRCSDFDDAASAPSLGQFDSSEPAPKVGYSDDAVAAVTSGPAPVRNFGGRGPDGPGNGVWRGGEWKPNVTTQGKKCGTFGCPLPDQHAGLCQVVDQGRNRKRKPKQEIAIDYTPTRQSLQDDPVWPPPKRPVGRPRKEVSPPPPQDPSAGPPKANASQLPVGRKMEGPDGKLWRVVETAQIGRHTWERVRDKPPDFSQDAEASAAAAAGAARPSWRRPTAAPAKFADEESQPYYQYGRGHAKAPRGPPAKPVGIGSWVQVLRDGPCHRRFGVVQSSACGYWVVAVEHETIGSTTVHARASALRVVSKAEAQAGARGGGGYYEGAEDFGDADEEAASLVAAAAAAGDRPGAPGRPPKAGGRKRAKGQCQRHPDCVRGLRHGGAGGPCKLRPSGSSVAAAADAAAGYTPAAAARGGPNPLVGRRVEVFVKEEGWLAAVVTAFDVASGKHTVHYDIHGVTEHLTLAKELWRMAPSEGVRSAVRPYQPGLGQCERNPLCDRGFKHGGLGGRCRIVGPSGGRGDGGVPSDPAAEAYRQLLSEQIEAEEAAAAEAAEEGMEEEGEEDAEADGGGGGGAAAGPAPDAELTGPITVRLVDELRVRLLLNVPLPLTGAWLGMHRQGELAIADHKIGEAARCRRLPEKPDPDGVLVTCTELRGLDDGPYTFVLYAGVTPTATTDAVDFRGGHFAPAGEE